MGGCLDLAESSLTGDVPDLGVHHFPRLQSRALPSTVYGGRAFECITDPQVMETFSVLQKHSPHLFEKYQFVNAGRRLGWRWTAGFYYAGGWAQHCETDWIDPEPGFDVNENEASFSYEAFSYTSDLHMLEVSTLSLSWVFLETRNYCSMQHFLGFQFLLPGVHEVSMKVRMTVQMIHMLLMTMVLPIMRTREIVVAVIYKPVQAVVVMGIDKQRSKNNFGFDS